MPRDRPPVRPTTPPQLRLMELGSKRERELFAAEVLQGVMKSESYRSVDGFGSAMVQEEDKEGAINDQRAMEREAIRWKTAEQTTLMLKLDRMRSETSRSQPHSRAQSPYTYTPAVQRHHSARADPSRGWFTANSDVLNVGKGTPGQPESRSARFVGKPTFDALNDDDEDDEGETFITATRVEEPRLARPAREAPHPGAHRKQIEVHRPSTVPQNMQASLDRWQAPPANKSQVAKQIKNYVGMDMATEARIKEEAAKAQRLADIMAYYSQPGLPYAARNGQTMFQDKLDNFNEGLEKRRLQLGEHIRKSQESSTPQAVALRASINAAICEDNKLVRKDDPVTGRKFYLPASSAASAISGPGPPPWQPTPIPWAMDNEAGEWVRLDKKPSRDPPWVVRKPRKTPQISVTDFTDHRTIVNQIELPPPRQPSEPAPAAPRSSINMGGGFVLRSDIQVDPARPTPSRPAYSRGLFLFPFSNEDASKLIDPPQHEVSQRRPPPELMDRAMTAPSSLQRARLNRIVPSRYSGSSGNLM